MLARRTHRDRYPPEVQECVAHARVAARHEAWAQRLPQEASQLWDFVGELGREERMALLARCVALNIDTSVGPKGYEADAVQVHVRQALLRFFSWLWSFSFLNRGFAEQKGAA